MEDASSGPFIWPWHHSSFTGRVLHGSVTRCNEMQAHNANLCSSGNGGVGEAGKTTASSPETRVARRVFSNQPSVLSAWACLSFACLTNSLDSFFVPFPIFTTSTWIIKRAICFDLDFFHLFPSLWVSVALVCGRLKFESSSSTAERRLMEQEEGNFCNFTTHYKP